MDTPKIEVFVHTQHFATQGIVTQKVHCGAMGICCMRKGSASKCQPIAVFRMKEPGGRCTCSTSRKSLLGHGVSRSLLPRQFISAVAWFTLSRPPTIDSAEMRRDYQVIHLAGPCQSVRSSRFASTPTVSCSLGGHWAPDGIELASERQAEAGFAGV